MKVFISWSGDPSKGIAEALHKWLPQINNAFDPFVSTQGIKSGERGEGVIAEQLEATDFGICCVTPQNQGKPWLNFEAGALSKSVTAGRVCSLLVGMSKGELDRPLAQFQARLATQEDVQALFRDLNKACQPSRTENQVDEAFDLCWPKLEHVFNKAAAEVAKGSGPPPATSPEPTLSELKGLVLSVIEEVRASRREQADMISPVVPEVVPRGMRESPIAWQILNDIERRLDKLTEHDLKALDELKKAYPGSPVGDKASCLWNEVLIRHLPPPSPPAPPAPNSPPPTIPHSSPPPARKPKSH